MNLRSAIEELAGKFGGVFRTSDLYTYGITAYDIQQLVRCSVIQRIKQGYYRLAQDEEQLSEAAQIAQLFPDGIICMYSALFHYGYSDRTPLFWDIAIDKNTSKSRFRLDYPRLQPYYLKPQLLAFGVTEADYEDCQLRIFDRDRLICECVFHENKLDRETYNKAIQGYAADPKKNIPNLLEYAQKRRILKKVKDRIGVWL